MMKKLCYRKIRKSFFTLVELIVSMAVFSLLMLALMQTFSGTQNVSTRAGAKTNTYAGVRLFMDMLTADLQNAYYFDTLRGYQRTFRITPASGLLSSLWMVTSKPYSPNGIPKDSKFCEVRYSLIPDSNAAARLGPYRIFYSVLPEFGGMPSAPVQSPDFDFRNMNSLSPESTMSGAQGSYILDNVVGLRIDRAYYSASGTTDWTNPGSRQNCLPNLVVVTLHVIDPEDYDAYYRTTDPVRRDAYLRKFTRVVSIPRGQEY